MTRRTGANLNRSKDNSIRRGETVPQARKSIREAILRGELVPGDPIKEEELEEKYGISRTPLRVALALLEDEGLVRKLPNSATIVAEPKGEEVRESVTLRYLIESMVVTVLATKNKEELRFRLEEVETIHSRMRTMIESLEQSVGRSKTLPRAKVEEFIELDMQFHSKLAEIAGFPWAAVQLRELRQRVLIYLLKNAQQDFQIEKMEITYNHHKAILEKIGKSNARGARNEVFRHLTEVARMWYPQILPFFKQLNTLLGLSSGKP